jgi:hypothetical protein
VVTRFNSHVLSLNRARTCVVHRLATVSPLDIDDSGALKIEFQRVQFVARGQDSGTRVVLDRPGLVIPEQSMLELHFVDVALVFALGERVDLQAQGLYDIIITLWRFGVAAVQAVEGYGRSLGIEFQAGASEA